MNTSDLPYFLPKDTSGQLNSLARIIDIPLTFVSNGGQLEVEAMALTIMYRHLDRIEKMQAMRAIHSINNQRLKGKLIEKIVNVKVNPQWEIWSLTNEELIADQKLHDDVSRFANYIGIPVSALSAKDFAKAMMKNRKVSKGGWATIVIWGALIFNNSELNKANAELANRSQLKSSSLYQR